MHSLFMFWYFFGMRLAVFWMFVLVFWVWCGWCSYLEICSTWFAEELWVLRLGKPQKRLRSWWPFRRQYIRKARELSMSLVQGRRRGWPRRHFTHHMALALETLAVRARCTRGCSLHLGRNVRRSLHTISLKFLYGGGDRTGAGSRSRLDKRRPHVPSRLAQISRDEALLPVR